MIAEIIRNISMSKDLRLTEDEKEYLFFHRHRFDFILSWLAEQDRNAKILDVGSHFLYGLMGAKYSGFNNLYGADLEEFNNISRERAGYINAVLTKCDLEKDDILFDDDFFDIIMLTETLEHFNFHPLRVFKEIARVLKPGGKVIITTPNLVRLNNRIKMLLGRSIHNDISENYTSGTHYREYSSREIGYLLDASGLQIEELYYKNFDYPGRGMMEIVLNRLAASILPSLNSNIVVVARK